MIGSRDWKNPRGHLPHASCSLQSLTTLMPNPLVMRHTVHLPKGVPFQAQLIIRRDGWRGFINRMFVEGLNPSTHIRSRFPLHPSLSAMDGVSIEVFR